MSSMSLESAIRILLFAFPAIVATMVDIRTRRIPDLCSLGGLLALAFWDSFFARYALFSEIVTSVTVFVIFLAIRRITHGIGWGDLKFAAFVGFFAGFPSCLVSFFVAALACILVFAFFLLRHEARDTRQLPFAPFLCLGALAAIPFRLGGIGL